MKFKPYPGHAVEASLSLDKPSSMGILYEANWMNANERIQQTPLTTFSKSNVNISSLGKYQDQLEQIKAYEADLRDASITKTLKELNGYKPSTLRSKKNRKQYHDWENEINKEDVIENPLCNHEQNSCHSTYYLSDMPSKRTDPKLRRSQTVIVKQPASSLSTENYYSGDVQGTIDLKDFYQRRSKLKQLEDKYSNREHLGMLSLQEHGVFNGTPQICDKKTEKKEFSQRNSSFNNSSTQIYHNDNDTINNRMNCYKASDFPTAYNGNQTNSQNYQSNLAANGENNGRILLNPLARNKSIKINHFDMVAATTDQQQVDPAEEDGKLFDANLKSVKKDKKNSFSRMFYNTISAGTKFPRVFLGRGVKNQRSKLNLEELNEKPEIDQEKINENSFKYPLSLPSSSPPSTLSSASPKSTSSFIMSRNSQLNIIQRKPGSDSSSDSDFVIPRPRLIVPVHTYARKRRTGNLVNDQPMKSKNEINCDNNLNKKGKFVLHI